MPPIPIIGILTALETCQTILTATGNTAGPLIPPVLLRIIGRFVFMSILIPVSVLIIEIASAPFASADLAISAISVTFGLSFTISGFVQCFLTAFVIEPTDSQLVPN